MSTRPSALCPACDSDGLSRWRRAGASEAPAGSAPEHWLLRCPRCGTAVTRPEQDPAQLKPLYEGGTYSQARGLVDPVLEPLRQLMLRERDRSLRGVAAGASVFEVGAGDGSYVSHLTDAGYRARGLEPSANGLGSDLVAPVGVEEADVAPHSQAVVMMWHVLEHLDDPARTLADVRGWLAPGGRLIVAVPNLSSLQARIGGDRWFHQDIPRHRTHFTERGLLMLLRREGFEPQRVRHVLLEQNPLGMWQTLLNRLTVRLNVAFRLLKRDFALGEAGSIRDIAVTTIGGLLLAPVAVCLELAAGLARRGGTVIVEASAP
jgi:SAM-dependent methyltransferase